jgi:hypothetical protein
MNRFLLYFHKAKGFAEYVREFSNLKKMAKEGLCEVQVLSFPQKNADRDFAELPAALRRLLFFAKPDLVICLDDGLQPIRPIFALESSTHVIARDHWMQRFPYLVGCAQEGVPGAYIMPGAMPHREKFAGRIDPLFYYAYDKVIEIHQTPLYIASWPSSDGEHLDRDNKFHDLPPHDSEDLARTFTFLNLVIEAALHGRDFSILMRDRTVVDLRDQIRKLGYAQLPQINDFERLAVNMREGRFLSFEELSGWIHKKGLTVPNSLPDRITKRQRNLIFTPQSDPRGNTEAQLRTKLVKRIELKGGDPYTGQPLAFDYIFCRLGSTPYERDANLVIDLSVLRFSDLAKYHREAWEKSPLQHTQFSKIKHIPTYTMHLAEGFSQTMKNFLRLYAFAADMIIFHDALLYF